MMLRFMRKFWVPLTLPDWQAHVQQHYEREKESAAVPISETIMTEENIPVVTAEKSSNTTTTISLNCLVDGDSADNVFSVEVAFDMLVCTLRDIIKKKNENDFRNIDANRLVLWSVSLSTDFSGAFSLLSSPEQAPCKLLPTTKIWNHFSLETLNDRIHIIIQKPSSPKVGMLTD